MHESDAMVGNQPQIGLPSRGKSGFRAPTSRGDIGEDPEVPKDLEDLAPPLKVVRLLKGPLFWIAISVLSVLTIVVAWLSWQGWEPGLLGRVLTPPGLIVSWAALMTAFTGWLLRCDK